MTKQSSYRPATVALHGGHEPDSATRARAVPIYQTTSYVFDSAEHAADVVRAEVAGQHLHAHHEPHHGGAGGSARAAGRRRRRRLPSRPARRRSRWRSSTSPAPARTSSRRRALYGGTYNLFRHTLARFGIETRFVDTSDAAASRRPIDGQTRAWSTPSRSATPRTTWTTSTRSPAVAHRRRRPVRRRQYRLAVRVPAFRPRRRHHRLLADQVHRRPRHVHRRRDRRFGPVRLGERKIPEFTAPDPSYHGLVFDDAFAPGPVNRLHRQGPRAAAARPRALPVAVQRLPVPPGTRDAAAADQGSLPQRPRGRRVAATPTRTWAG